ncbi:hypothetical protein T4B_14533 [Trichinella pseudospiralis]|uniref:Uncharacterized protein n=1 Tax=Trichinella pseudospiralis TaxID=6337 RepID=A0A0V1J5J3_TRIPS|nr:hypothetical protein T4B_14533 [Trichinella pseudospiralis]
MFLIKYKCHFCNSHRIQEHQETVDLVAMRNLFYQITFVDKPTALLLICPVNVAANGASRLAASRPKFSTHFFLICFFQLPSNFTSQLVIITYSLFFSQITKNNNFANKSSNKYCFSMYTIDNKLIELLDHVYKNLPQKD